MAMTAVKMFILGHRMAYCLPRDSTSISQSIYLQKITQLYHNFEYHSCFHGVQPHLFTTYIYIYIYIHMY